MHAQRKSLEKSKTAHVGRIRSPAASLIGALVLAAATLAGARAPFWRSGFAGFLLLTIFFGSPGPVFAQTESSNCDNATAGDPIHCVIDGDEGETGDVSIDIENINITATETGVAGKILNRTGNSGHVTIKVNGGEIDVTGNHSGIDSLLYANGKLFIDVQNVDITTNGLEATGVRAHHWGEGDVVIRVQDGSIKADGDATSGGVHATQYAVGNVDVRITDVDIETGDGGGVRAVQAGRGSGDINILVKGGSITTGTNQAADPSMDSTGANSDYGINGFFFDVDDPNNPTGLVTIDVQDVEIVTNGLSAHGVQGVQESSGDIVIRVRGGSIKTKSTALSTYLDTFANGINVRHAGTGDIDIDLTGGLTIETAGKYSYGLYAVGSDVTGDIDIDAQNISIVTSGDNAYGIAARHAGTGLVDINVENVSIETTGAASHGIYARGADAGGGDIRVLVSGGSILASGAGASGVKVGSLNDDGEVTRAGGLDEEDGYRKQTVTVNGRVMGNEAGVYLAGGGRVVIGPQGSVGAKSGIAILATGDTPAADPNDPAIKPKLRVDLNLGGRKVEQAIGNNWIINDGGETTIAVNRTVLHEGATGVTGRTARNGAWNVTMAGPGVRVTNRTDPDPANWITEASDTHPVPADRDFSAEDFTETRRPRPPPPPMCPAGQVGTPPDCSAPVEPEPLPEPLPEPEPDPDPDPETGMPMFIEEYAPRAALYEVLPDFMLRMQNWAPTRQHLSLPESPVYIRLLGNTGSQEFKRSTVNANYDAGRFAVEAGVNIPLFENLDIWASMHHITGSAEVSSPVNGGDIDVTGAGLSVDAYWSSENDYYATGRLSLTDYDMDLSSNTIGRLKSNGDANGQSLHVEAGRRMTLSENLHWTPRAWLGHTRISVDQFTDAVDSRVSFPTTDRLTGGFGVMAETVRAEYGGGELLLRGSLDFEQKLGDSKTVALVSGERLSAEPEKNSALLSLSGAWNKGSFTYSAELSARQDLHSGGEDYSGVIHVGMRF